MRHVSLLALFLTLAAGTAARASAPDDAKLLKAEIELLQAKLKILEKENELLRREIELMKKEAGVKPASKEDAKSGLGAGAKVTMDGVDFEVVKCFRSGPTRVTVEITLLCEKADKKLGGAPVGYGVVLTAADGTLVKPKQMTRTPNGIINIKQGVKSKLEFVIDGVSTDITDFGSIVLHASFSTPEDDIVFKKIPITKK